MQQFVLGIVVQIVPDVSLLKQDLGAAGSVVDGLGVDESAEPAQLLKAAHIVEQTAQPGQTDLLLGQVQRAGDAAAEPGHPVGMVDLETDFGVLIVIVRRIGGKGVQCLLSVENHRRKAPFILKVRPGPEARVT